MRHAHGNSREQGRIICESPDIDLAPNNVHTDKETPTWLEIASSGFHNTWKFRLNGTIAFSNLMAGLERLIRSPPQCSDRTNLIALSHRVDPGERGSSRTSTTSGEQKLLQGKTSTKMKCVEQIRSRSCSCFCAAPKCALFSEVQHRRD